MDTLDWYSDTSVVQMVNIRDATWSIWAVSGEWWVPNYKAKTNQTNHEGVPPICPPSHCVQSILTCPICAGGTFVDGWSSSRCPVTWSAWWLFKLLLLLLLTSWIGIQYPNWIILYVLCCYADVVMFLFCFRLIVCCFSLFWWWRTDIKISNKVNTPTVPR